MNEAPESVPWTVVDVFKAGLFFLALAALGFGFQFTAAHSLFQALNPRLLNLAGFVVAYGGIVFAVWMFSLRKYGLKADRLGLGPFSLWPAVKAGILWLIAIKLLTVAYAALAGAFGAQPPPEVAENVRRLFGPGFLGLVLAAIVTAVIAPFAEEILFRGFIYAALRRRLGAAGAVVTSSVIFALFHPDPWLLVPIFGIGLVLAHLYESSGSLGPPIILHSFNNLLSVILLYYAV